MIEFCKCCSAKELTPLWEDVAFVPGKVGTWARCVACGSDTADRTYADTAGEYGGHNIAFALENGFGRDGLLDYVRSNADWFCDHRAKAGGRDFLDIGHNEGSMLTAMQDRGWSVHGFDVTEAHRLGAHTTIAPEFSARLFPQTYHAVNCREVLEHVPEPGRFLAELVAATSRGGLLQVQTPRPTVMPNAVGYQFQHLQLYSPVLLRWELGRLGMTVIGERVWPIGMAILAQKQ